MTLHEKKNNLFQVESVFAYLYTYIAFGRLLFRVSNYVSVCKALVVIDLY